MKSSKQSRREAKQLFKRCLSDGLLDEGRARQEVDHVLAARPRGYLAMLGYLQRLIKLDAERHLARVESAIALSDAERSAVRDSLQKRYGQGLTFQFSENPALLGGMRVQVGSDVYDGSVRRRLNEVRDAFESA
jgi:F-type H+-transporting ATPase subunit delta